jgi:hypothetical protein
MTLGACIAGVRTGQWLWLSVPIALLVCGILGYLVASRIKAQARSAVVGTVYGLTTRRALIMHTYPALTIQARPVDTITDVTIINNSGDFADLSLAAASASPGLIFRGVLGPERARAQLMRVIRDPQATDQELAASEAYALAMHQLMQRSGSRPS